MDKNVWGPPYWFTLHTIAMTYPEFPNETIKKKYYDFIQNIPLFIPNRNMGNYFLQLLDKYPVTPYLSDRLSLMKWFHFIHNKINVQTGKTEMSFHDSLESYYSNYKPKEVIYKEKNKNKIKYIQIGTLIGLFFFNYLYI